MRIRRGLSLSLLVQLSACGGSNPIQPLACGSSDYECLTAKALCQDGVLCGGIGASEQNGCENWEVGALHGTLFPPSFDDAVARGAIRIDFAKLNDCYATVSSMPSCGLGRALEIGFGCLGQSVTGTVPTGGACISPAECESGYCNQGTSSNLLGCMGTCQPFPVENAPCAAGDVCGAADYCAQNVCLPRIAAGQPCNPETPCAAGLDCLIPSQAQSGTCVAFGKAGDPCTSLLDCDDGLFCQAAACAPLPGDGEPCDTTSGCVPGEACAAAGGALRCTRWLDIGAACDPTGPGACPHDAPCDGTKVCARLKVFQAGDPCNTGSCESGPSGPLLYCDDTGTCAPGVPLGAACTPGTANPCLQGECDPMTKMCAITCS